VPSFSVRCLVQTLRGDRPVLKQQAMPVPAEIVPVCTMEHFGCLVQTHQPNDFFCSCCVAGEGGGGVACTARAMPSVCVGGGEVGVPFSFQVVPSFSCVLFCWQRRRNVGGWVGAECQRESVDGRCVHAPLGAGA
jgi:hypothetical protein